MSVRRLPAVAATALLVGVMLAAPAAASVQQSAAVTGMTSGRLGPTVTALVGLASVVFGCLALGRIGGMSTGNSRKGALVALVSGLISLVLGSVFAATADGGPGTGNGIVGSWAAMAFGLIGVVLGGLALNRSGNVGRMG
ncbi:DUF6223 family protein [Nocardia sp. NBC_00508]|uniref:DUF6223 family protein n=1 Tax=Nocardia sp. NBC_00508 TaxID=2975992 RepID=UPI002E802457|nr:DUF6223 family protein [Nocardia sp. NBC_00508]WUD66210.1 DUF6223 family protein [Nocardia sp. NBC_00508]